MKGENSCATAILLPANFTFLPEPLGGGVAGFAYLVPKPAEKG